MILALPGKTSNQFAVILTISLIFSNAIAAFILAREGSQFDRFVRMSRDMGRLTALVSAIEETDAVTARSIVKRSGTGYTRFSLDEVPIALSGEKRLADVENIVREALPLHDVRASAGGAPADRGPALMVISVRISTGPHAGKWINSLVYPLRSAVAWEQKSGFFAPLAASLLTTLGIGLLYIKRITSPFRRLAKTADLIAGGNYGRRMEEKGPEEIRDAARAINNMQDQIQRLEASRMHILAALGHDIATPITSLRVRAEMIEDEETRTSMIRTLEDMATMADDLLNYSREISQSEPASDFDLAEMLRNMAQDHGLVFIGPDRLDVCCPKVAMGRAMSNVAENMLRYAGGGRVFLSRPSDRAIVRFSDDGPGIPAQMLARVTEPFVRCETSRSTRTGGSGLGLAIAHNIVRLQGGTLCLSNRSEGGLDVTVTLPLPGKAAECAPSRAGRQHSAAFLGGPA